MSCGGMSGLLLGAVFLLMRWKASLVGVSPPKRPQAQEAKEPLVPCYFVFGDSLSDCGNNNNLSTLAKANYQPYGVDFAASFPTGRFTNNRTFVDVLTELLGFDNFIPPFNQSMGLEEAIQGVNYASGGAGILYDTGRLDEGDVISFYQQIQHHQSIAEKIGNEVNLTKCLYTINIGSNDYINNYFNDDYVTGKIFSPIQFASHLMIYYRAYVKVLYGLGARKIVFYLLTEIGCALGEIYVFGATGCVESVNNATMIFNSMLVPLIVQLNEELPDAKFIYINSTAVETSSFVDAGVTVFNSSCCTSRSDGQCDPGTTPCSNRDEYYFWDMYHPTDVVVKVFGEYAYYAQNTSVAIPYDIRTLVEL